MKPEDIIAILSVKASIAEGLSKGMEDEGPRPPLRLAQRKSLSDNNLRRSESSSPPAVPRLATYSEHERGIKQVKVFKSRSRTHVHKKVSDEEFIGLQGKLLASASPTSAANIVDHVTLSSNESSMLELVDDAPDLSNCPVSNEQIKVVYRKFLAASLKATIEDAIDEISDDCKPSIPDEDGIVKKPKSTKLTKTGAPVRSRIHRFNNNMSTLSSTSKRPATSKGAP